MSLFQESEDFETLGTNVQLLTTSIIQNTQQNLIKNHSHLKNQPQSTQVPQNSNLFHPLTHFYKQKYPINFMFHPQSNFIFYKLSQNTSDLPSANFSD